MGIDHRRLAGQGLVGIVLREGDGQREIFPRVTSGQTGIIGIGHFTIADGKGTGTGLIGSTVYDLTVYGSRIGYLDAVAGFARQSGIFRDGSVGRDRIGDVTVDRFIGGKQIALLKRDALIIHGDIVGGLHIADPAVIGQIAGIVQFGTLVDHDRGHHGKDQCQRDHNTPEGDHCFFGFLCFAVLDLLLTFLL